MSPRVKVAELRGPRDRQSSDHQAVLPKVLPRFGPEDPTIHTSSGDSTTVSLAWAQIK